MMYFRRGQKGPKVVLMQIILNHAGATPMLAVDGKFGMNSNRAVRAFQNRHRLAVDGIVGPKTWGKITQVSGLQTIDVIDAVDPSLVSMEASAIRKHGGDPVVMYGMSNGVGQASVEIQRRAKHAGSIGLLRWHGHGGPGYMNVSAGKNADPSELSGMGSGTVSSPLTQLDRIKPLMSLIGCVEIHGCNVAQGNAGSQLLQQLARKWDVPVTAGIETQYGGNGDSFKSFRFEGPTKTGFPTAAPDLAGWASRAEANSSVCGASPFAA